MLTKRQQRILLRLVGTELQGATDNVKRMDAQVRRMSKAELQQEYNNTGETAEQIIFKFRERERELYMLQLEVQGLPTVQEA